MEFISYYYYYYYHRRSWWSNMHNDSWWSIGTKLQFLWYTCAQSLKIIALLQKIKWQTFKEKQVGRMEEFWENNCLPLPQSDDTQQPRKRMIPFFNLRYLGFPYILVSGKIVIDLEGSTPNNSSSESGEIKWL